MVIFLKEWITFDELKSVLDKNLITSEQRMQNMPDSEQLMTEVIDSWNRFYRHFIMEEDILSGNEQINEVKSFSDKNLDIE